MQTSDLIHRAEHCLRTGQPNLAVLYMAKAQTQCREERREIADAFKAIGLFYQDAMEVFSAAAEEVQKAFLPFARAFQGMATAISQQIEIRTVPGDFHQPFGEYPKPRVYRPGRD